jgi:transcriptional regulator with XRE-family HTH domain
VVPEGVLPLRYKGLKEVKNPIGERIKLERERRGITQADLAADVGITSKALSQIEGGKVSPRKTTIFAIEKKLKLKAGSLYGAEDTFRPTLREMQALVEGAGDELPLGPMMLVLQRFSKEAPEVRAATLAVLYGDPEIADLGALSDKADSR